MRVRARGGFGDLWASYKWGRGAGGVVSDVSLRLLREALQEGKDVSAQLWTAHRDQLDRTARLTQVMSLGLAGQLGAISLIVQVGTEVPPATTILFGAGIALTFASASALVLAQVNLPSDLLWSWGSTPWAYARHAETADGDERAWVAYLTHGLAKRVAHNAQVIALLIRRRTTAVLLGGTGWTAFLSGVAYIIGGRLLV